MAAIFRRCSTTVSIYILFRCHHHRFRPVFPSSQMTYPEFLEGIARVAILKWEDATSTPKDKIERAIAATASLLDTPATTS